MPARSRTTTSRPPLVLASALLWGLIEFFALCRSRLLWRSGRET